MNDLIFQLHTPEELRLLSSVGHWIAGGIFLVVSLIAFLQAKGTLRSKPYLWQLLVVAGGLMFIPYTLLHHSPKELPLVWQVIFLDPQQRQHFIMFNLITFGGIIELLFVLKKLQAKAFHLVFPGVILTIGLMFLFHPQHGTSEALAYSVPYHTALGIVLLLAGITKVIKFKLAWILFLFISSLMLLLYNEPAGTYEMQTTNLMVSESNLPMTVNSDGFIENLRARDYPASPITIESTATQNSSFTSYVFSYFSDDLKIYGRMNVPTGEGPFPVIILNHGYFNQSTFVSGDGTQAAADILVREGYLTLASDYRGFGKSESGTQNSRGHNPNYAIDVLNLVTSVKNVAKADPSKIGMWGHSMGGEVALRSIEATDNIKATVLWAPTSGRVSDNASFYGGRRGVTPSENSGADGASPINYLRYISSPISLHQGLSDTEVNPKWSKELNEALKKEGKTVEYFEYPGQDHNFRNLGWGVISQRTVEFFDRYL